MNNINELTILKEMHNIEYAKSKYFFIGLIISFIPYTGILLIANKMNMSNIFLYTIVGFTIISYYRIIIIWHSDAGNYSKAYHKANYTDC